IVSSFECISSGVHVMFVFFFSSRRRHTRSKRDWSSDVCSSDLRGEALRVIPLLHRLGLTSLTITYRNDTGAPASADRMHHLGLAEWEDTEAAIEYAVARGAR